MAKKEKVSSRHEAAFELMKQKLPGCFENQPAPVYADGELRKLIDEVLSL